MTACRPVFSRFRLAAVLLIALLAGLPPGSAAEVRGHLAMNVVLVHGFWNTGAIFDPLVAKLQAHGCNCFAPSLQPNDFHLGVRDLSRKLATRIDTHFGRRVPMVIVAFSMGGLVARDYVQNLDRGTRVRALFMISTANRGTWWAATSPRAGVRELAPGSHFLAALNADESAWRTTPVRAYWTPLDLIVLPSTNSRCTFGETTAVWCPVHSWMVRDERVTSDIVTRIDAMRADQVEPFARRPNAP